MGKSKAKASSDRVSASYTVRMPSLTCHFEEICRYLVDDFVIRYRRRLHKEDFIMKNEDFSKHKKGKREYLNDSLTRNLTKSLNEYFQSNEDS